MDIKHIKRFFSVIQMIIIIMFSACNAEGELFDNWIEWALVTDGGEWTKKADFGGYRRSAAVGFSVGNKAYFGTGGTGGTSFIDFWEYNPVSDSWTQKADFAGEGRRNAVGFSIGNRGYIGTGYGFIGASFSSRYYQDFWEYNPVSNVWTRKADFAGEAREQAAGFSIGNKGYIGTGRSHGNRETLYIDFWEYDPVTDSWTQKADFAGNARSHAVGFAIEDLGYIGMGTGSSGGSTQILNDFWAYNPLSDSWTRRADASRGVNSFSLGQSESTGFSIGKKGYISNLEISRYHNPWDNRVRAERTFWEYDPVSNTWRRCAIFESSRSYGILGVGFSIDNKGYFVVEESQDFWEFTP